MSKRNCAELIGVAPSSKALNGSAFLTLPEELLDVFNKSQYGQIYQDDELDEDTKTATFTDEYNSDRAHDTAPIRELIKNFLVRNFWDR